MKTLDTIDKSAQPCWNLLVVWPCPPYVHLMSLTWWMHPGLSCFHRSSTFVYYCPCKPKRKTRVGLGMRLSIYHLCSHSPRLYKGINFYLQTIFSQSWSPKGRRDIGNTLTLKDRAGLNWDFWATVEGFQVSQWWLLADTNCFLLTVVIHWTPYGDRAQCRQLWLERLAVTVTLVVS